MVLPSQDAAWQVEFYPPWDEGGPVLDFFRKQPADVQARMVRLLERVEEFGVLFLSQQGQAQKVSGVNEPLYELKLRGGGGHSYRLFVSVVNRTVVVVHLIAKKARRLPRADVRTAEQRARDVREYYQARGDS